MISNILFFMHISSGGFFAASFLKRKYEEALPITIFLIIIIQYVFALFGNLRLGAYFVFIFAAILVLCSVLNVIIKKSYKTFLSSFITPGFFAFAVFYMVVNFANAGKLASAWDEFSHWADVVKVMSTINDFATNPASESAFKSYVPAMPLFQYNLQVLNQLIKRDVLLFSEWRLYLCYQIATYALLLPIFKNITWKHYYKGFLMGVVIFLLPSMYDKFYNTIYIDVFLGILAGYSLFLALETNALEPFSLLGFLLSLTVLVLTKDAGFPLALFLGVMYILKQLIHNKDWKIRIPYIVATITAVFLPKLSWEYHLSVNSIIKSFGRPISWSGFLNTIFKKNPADYRWITFNNFLHKLTQAKVAIGDTTIKISYILILLFLIVILYMLLREKNFENSAWRPTAIVGIVVGTILYVFGMVAMYMFKFSEYEATRLASFKRYIYIYMYMLSTAAWLMYIKIVLEKGMLNGRRIFAGIMLVIMLSCKSALWFVFRRYALSSVTERAPYIQLSQRVHETIGDADPKRVYIVSQEDSGFDYWVLRYSIRPHKANGDFTWSIGKSFYEGDVWTKELDKKAWQMELMNDYDYVLLYKTNSYFRNKFASVFNDPDGIIDKTIYVVDKKTGKLLLNEFSARVVFETKEEFKGKTEFLQTIDLAPLIDKNGLNSYRISFEAKSAVPGVILMCQQYGSTSRYIFEHQFNISTVYRKYSFVVIPQKSDFSVENSVLTFYGGYNTDVIPEIKNIVIEVFEKND